MLPGVRGNPDAASLDLLTGYLYHPNDLVRQYAAYGLAYWPEDIASAHLFAWLQTRGPSDELINWLFWHRSAHVLNLVDEQTIIYFVNALAAVKNDQTHALLWTFMQRGISVEQTAICLSWFANPDDLPRLGAMLLNADIQANLLSLPYALHRSFGKAALPYLQAAANSANPAMREACDREMHPPTS